MNFSRRRFVQIMGAAVAAAGVGTLLPEESDAARTERFVKQTKAYESWISLKINGVDVGHIQPADTDGYIAKFNFLGNIDTVSQYAAIIAQQLRTVQEQGKFHTDSSGTYSFDPNADNVVEVELLDDYVNNHDLDRVQLQNLKPREYNSEHDGVTVSVQEVVYKDWSNRRNILSVSLSDIDFTQPDSQAEVEKRLQAVTDEAIAIYARDNRGRLLAQIDACPKQPGCTFER